MALVQMFKFATGEIHKKQHVTHKVFICILHSEYMSYILICMYSALMVCILLSVQNLSV